MSKIKTYKVRSARLQIGQRLYRRGQHLTEIDLKSVKIDHLLKRGVIELVNLDLLNLDTPVVSDKNSPKFKKRLAIVTGVWQRPEIFKIFANQTKKLKHKDVDIVVIVAGSEGEDSKSMVEKHGFKYIEIRNTPLAHKMNATTDLAGQYAVDYVLCVGSDDIISQELFDIYVEQMNKGIDYVAVLDWYFYDTQTDKFAYWGGYTDKREGHTCGAGRLLSNRLMRLFGWQPWNIEHSHILDDSMQKKLIDIPHTSYIFKLKDKGVYGIDIKSSTNMTPFELWANTQYIEPTKELKRCVE